MLVIEDDPDDREIYGKLLWYNGFEVLFADTGQAGLRVALEHRPDLVLLDLILPEASGIDVCAALRGDPRTRRIPIVVLTARSAAEMGEAARLAGCDLFLEKPLAPLEVLHAVEALIGRPPPPTPEADDPPPPAAPLRRSAPARPYGRKRGAAPPDAANCPDPGPEGATPEDASRPPTPEA